MTSKHIKPMYMLCFLFFKLSPNGTNSYTVLLITTEMFVYMCWNYTLWNRYLLSLSQASICTCCYQHIDKSICGCFIKKVHLNVLLHSEVNIIADTISLAISSKIMFGLMIYD